MGKLWNQIFRAAWFVVMDRRDRVLPALCLFTCEGGSQEAGSRDVCGQSSVYRQSSVLRSFILAVNNSGEDGHECHGEASRPLCSASCTLLCGVIPGFLKEAPKISAHPSSSGRSRNLACALFCSVHRVRSRCSNFVIYVSQ